MLLDPRRPRSVEVLPERAARRFCWTVVAGSGIAWLIVAALNFIVNPYGQYPPRFFPAQVQASRAKKLQLLQQTEPEPEGLILGSSRVMKLEPDYLEQQTGYRFFNAGVNYGTPEDWLALVRYYPQAVGHAPRIILLGLDVSAFSERLPVDARLLTLPPLAGQIPEAIRLRDRGRRWQQLLSWQQTRASLQSLYHWGMQKALPEPVESYRPDGLLIYHLREQQIREGRYDFAAALADNRREYQQLYAGFDRLSPLRCRLLESLAETCHQQGVRLITFVTPMHPDLSRALDANTDHRERARELVIFTQRLAERYDFEFHDLSRIEVFGGNPQAFVDGIHPLEINTRKMINQMLSHRSEGSDAL